MQHGEDLRIKCRIKVGETRVSRRREKMEKRQSGIHGAISSVTGKIQKAPERPKNKVVRKVSQKFSKIINIIK